MLWIFAVFSTAIMCSLWRPANPMEAMAPVASLRSCSRYSGFDHARATTPRPSFEARRLHGSRLRMTAGKLASRCRPRFIPVEGQPMKAAELFDLTGQVALVTGASSGLGVRFAEVLAANVAAVALVARRAERLAAVKDRIGQNGGRAVAASADVADRAAVRG